MKKLLDVTSTVGIYLLAITVTLLILLFLNFKMNLNVSLFKILKIVTLHNSSDDQ